MITLPLAPVEATKIALKKLSNLRMRDVLERRFGLQGKGADTLEAIGRKYKITRERVRQIEADALRHLRKEETVSAIRPVLDAIEAHIVRHGGVMAEHHLFATLGDQRQHPHIALLLEAGTGKGFSRVPENEICPRRWATDRDAVAKGEKTVAGLIKDLEQTGHPVSQEELHRMLARHIQDDASGKNLDVKADVIDAHINSAQSIKQNPYGEYGLSHWSAVTPRGMRDKAYLALKKSGKAMHFSEVAAEISKAGWSVKKAHPQTVHNELIKDQRFVLVGRGMYALREWGYQPGVVRDVLVSVMKESGRALAKDEIIKLVLAKRLVQPQTVLLNLQNRSLFRRTDDGKFRLA
ncbi:MAG: RNA polymerase sigma factor [Parcubacteria group bacterium GW2011_GWA2_45_30]|nr:MAG: RNA polymerase sigma factor [Parcubacteria group bacterium GW2011_GWA2_45_30]